MLSAYKLTQKLAAVTASMNRKNTVNNMCIISIGVEVSVTFTPIGLCYNKDPAITNIFFGTVTLRYSGVPLYGVKFV